MPWSNNGKSLIDYFNGMNNKMDNFLDDFFAQKKSLKTLFESNDLFVPNTDIKANKDHYKIKVEIPGVKKDDIEVKIDNNQLIISGEKKIEKEDKDESYYVLECRHGSFVRSLPIQEDMDVNNISISFSDGVLDIKIPRVISKESNPKNIPIN